ncbi:hypothetical protein PIB30_044975, partial [Stylosanthes scabra]|nr:hypothetical protein [Stylosanthes scabra]
LGRFHLHSSVGYLLEGIVDGCEGAGIWCSGCSAANYRAVLVGSVRVNSIGFVVHPSTLHGRDINQRFGQHCGLRGSYLIDTFNFCSRAEVLIGISHCFDHFSCFFWCLVHQSSPTGSVNHCLISGCQSFVEIIDKQEIRYRMMGARSEQFLESLVVLVQSFPVELCNSGNFLSDSVRLGRWKVLFQELLLEG